MKSIVKKSRLLLLSLVWFLVIWVVSIAIWITIINTAPDDSEHKVRLHSLYLDGSVTDKDLIGVESGKKNLDINNWLVVGNDHIVDWSVRYSSIGWGETNKMKWDTINITGWGIWWWGYNTINDWRNSAIGGWYTNTTNGNNTVIVWWSNWNSYRGWVVLWWDHSFAYDYGVVLWGGLNLAKKYSLVLWKSAHWEENSFAWNGNAELNTARIEANSWVLIWTYSPIHGVSLVVSWSVKLGSGHDGNKWAIRLNSSWCLTMYDGHTHVLGKKSKSMCGVASWCQFGGVLLQDWDVVTGYSVSYSTGCNSNDNIISVECNNWNLSRPAYPYCYNIDSDPRWVSWWNNWWNNWWGSTWYHICDINHNGKLEISDETAMISCNVRNSLLLPGCDLNHNGYYDGWDFIMFYNEIRCVNLLLGS